MFMVPALILLGTLIIPRRYALSALIVALVWLLGAAIWHGVATNQLMPLHIIIRLVLSVGLLVLWFKK